MQELMRFFGWIFFALFGAGCAHIERIPPKYLPAPVSDSRESRVRAYESGQVSDIGPNRCHIGRKTYRVSALRSYAEGAGMQPVLEALNHSHSARKIGVIAWALSPALGFLAGGYIENLGGIHPSYAENEFGSRGDWTGAAIGAAAGGLFFTAGWLVGNSYNQSAAAAFNSGLLKDMHLDIAPQPGGAKAGISRNF